MRSNYKKLNIAIPVNFPTNLTESRRQRYARKHLETRTILSKSRTVVNSILKFSDFFDPNQHHNMAEQMILRGTLEGMFDKL